jgi:Fic family protein
LASSVSRAGRFVKQPAGYTAFVPAPLPPDPPVRMDGALVGLLSGADQAVGRLDGVTRTLPNPDLFVAMYVRREAVESSQIEGTQSTLEDVLAFELDPRRRDVPQDVEEVVNYVRAMDYGLERLATLPLSLRLIREIHAELLSGARGADKLPGEFRRSQNWIGPGGASLSQATFVPPPVPEMTEALYDLENFLHEEGDLPVLVRCGLTHPQFETIHPFLDGNGRVGRLLIAFQLVHAGVLHRPLLYISHYLKRHRAEYYDGLGAVRQDGGWEGWLRFFLRGVAETAEEATATAEAIVRLREEHRVLLEEGLGLNGLRLLDLLFRRPLVNVGLIRDELGVAFNTANKLAENLEALGLVEETTGGQRNRVFRYDPYWRLLEEPEAAIGEDVTPQTTESRE